MFYKLLTLSIGMLMLTSKSIAQQTNTSQTTSQNTTLSDSLSRAKDLPEITIVGRGSKSDYQQLPEIVGTSIYAGKKNALIVLDNVQGNVVSNNMRQVMAKVPGVHIWESDPSGIQIGIAARGLSPNRSWEFNIRQNGYDIAADPFGYPEAYYNPQLQAVQRIEIIRGQGSLQYGPQFGGMVNYIIRNGSEINKPVAFETQQTVGSNGLFNTYNAIGGKTKNVHYYAFFDHRNGEGWRQNSRYYTNAGFATVTYKFNPRLGLTAEVMQSHFRSQQPGGLTDSLLKQDAKLSFRARNWFDITWTTPALSLNYEINDRTRWNTKFFSTIGDRNSVGYLQSILVKDTINKATGEYNNRVLNIDQYRNYGMESRILTNYHLLGWKNTLSGGIRLYTGETWRRADGKGTTGSDYDMTVIGKYPRDIHFRSNNAAVFAENIFRAGKKLLLIPGVRFEWLEGKANGLHSITSSGQEIWLQDIHRSRNFVLAGFGSEYHLTDRTEIYSSIAQAYRPIQFANLQAPPTTDIVDPNLEDAKGYNLDIGYRGKIKNYIEFDISTFLLEYKNRVGTISMPTGQRLITNVGASTSKGIESMVSFNLLKALHTGTQSDLTFNSTYSYTDAKYSGDHKDAAIKGKKVENAPTHIFRGGITSSFSGLTLSLQVSYSSSTYSDANNTEVPTANSQNGLIPAYTIGDFSVGYTLAKNISLKGGINNLTDATYFTRRAGGYPGPGALPGDGRTCYLGINAKL